MMHFSRTAIRQVLLLYLCYFYFYFFIYNSVCMANPVDFSRNQTDLDQFLLSLQMDRDVLYPLLVLKPRKENMTLMEVTKYMVKHASFSNRLNIK